MIDGTIIVNKPANFTSRDVVNKVSKVFKTKKVGHTGTLDPLATGVLLITIGKATKISEFITSLTKEYIAEVKFGLLTDTLDITGKIIKEQEYLIDEFKLKEIVNSFKGSYNQQVPLYSAVKINGKKLYEYARNNEFVELPSKMVDILEIEVLKVTSTGFSFRCLVSKGTYIRSLIKDICDKLGTIGVMTNLVRTKQGSFTLQQAASLTDIKNINIISIEELLSDMFTIVVDEDLKFKILNGQIINNDYNQDLVVFKDNKVIAIYKTYEKDNTKLKPYKMFR